MFSLVKSFARFSNLVHVAQSKTNTTALLNSVQAPLVFNSLSTLSYASFSDFFRERDKAELLAYEGEKLQNKTYKRIHKQWKIPLEKKKQRAERRLAAKALEQPPADENQKLVIHNPGKPLILPAQAHQIFAVVQIGGRQYKVVEDDLVMAEWMKEYDINDKVVFDRVLLLGTKDYTAIGRPVVETAKVYATVEEQTLSEKVIIFKKRRRAQYKRNKGMKASRELDCDS